MIRYLICEECENGKRLALHPEDKAMGFQQRRVKLTAKRPDDLHITVGDMSGPMEKIPVPEMLCDSCNVKIPDGSTATAITFWREAEEPEAWETEYGVPK